MDRAVKIGLIGDFEDSRRPSQVKTNEALTHASEELSVSIDPVWLPTDSLTNYKESDLNNFDGIWAGPADYLNPDGALNLIKLCREFKLPFIGT